MPDTASTVADTMDPTISRSMDQNFATVHSMSLQHYQDGVQMARKAYARLEGAFDYFSAQAEATFLQGITNMDLAQQILGQRSVQAQPQVGSLWAGGSPTSNPSNPGLPSSVKAAAAA